MELGLGVLPSYLPSWRVGGRVNVLLVVCCTKAIPKGIPNVTKRCFGMVSGRLVWFGIRFGMCLVWECQRHTKAYQRYVLCLVWECQRHTKAYQSIHQRNTKQYTFFGIQSLHTKQNQGRGPAHILYALRYDFGMSLVYLWYSFGTRPH